jgi:hypothetical protein
MSRYYSGGLGTHRLSVEKIGKVADQNRGRAMGRGAAGGGLGVNSPDTGSDQALNVSGPSSFGGVTTFSRSGKLMVPYGAKSVTKTGLNLSSTSIVLATVQGASSVAVLNVVPTVGTPNGDNSSFTVNLTAAAASATTVAWFIVN